MRTYRENPTSKAAIVQALRYHFNKTPSEIVELTGLSRSRVSHLTMSSATGDLTSLSWWERKHKQESIIAAGQMLSGIIKENKDRC